MVTKDGVKLALRDFEASQQPATAALVLSYAREAFENGELDEQEFDEALSAVESYLWKGGWLKPDTPPLLILNPLEITLEDLELSVRSYHALLNDLHDYGNPKPVTVRDVIRKTADELMGAPNFGKKSLQEVRETLFSMGLTLHGERWDPATRKWVPLAGVSGDLPDRPKF